MDNLAKRRLLAYIAIPLALVSLGVMTYGIIENKSAVMLLGLSGIVVTYLISVWMGRLRKAGKQG